MAHPLPPKSFLQSCAVPRAAGNAQSKASIRFVGEELGTSEDRDSSGLQPPFSEQACLSVGLSSVRPCLLFSAPTSNCVGAERSPGSGAHTPCTLARTRTHSPHLPVRILGVLIPGRRLRPRSSYAARAQTSPELLVLT